VENLKRAHESKKQKTSVGSSSRGGQSSFSGAMVVRGGGGVVVSPNPGGGGKSLGIVKSSVAGVVKSDTCAEKIVATQQRLLSLPMPGAASGARTVSFILPPAKERVQIPKKKQCSRCGTFSCDTIECNLCKKLFCDTVKTTSPPTCHIFPYFCLVDKTILRGPLLGL